MPVEVCACCGVEGCTLAARVERPGRSRKFRRAHQLKTLVDALTIADRDADHPEWGAAIARKIVDGELAILAAETAVNWREERGARKWGAM